MSPSRLGFQEEKFEILAVNTDAYTSEAEYFSGGRYKCFYSIASFEKAMMDWKRVLLSC